MLRRPFGSTREQVSVIGQGTWKIRDHAAAGPTLLEGIKLGLSHIDTAELYENQSGSESLLGRILGEQRSRVFLASKVLPGNASYKGTLAHAEASLKRLRTDHLDLYYLHWWDGDHPISETMRAMAELVDAGKVRHVGVSNFDVAELEEARSALGAKRLAANQVLYHLGARGIESEVLPWCERHGVAVVGYSPFGSGRFPAPRSPGGRTLISVAERLAKTPRQVALAFLTRRPALFTIPKAESLQHVQENAGGAFALPEDAVAEIEAAFPVKPGLSFL